MITIQKVSEALHDIETQVFRNLEINPFPQSNADMFFNIQEKYIKYISLSNGGDIKVQSIELAASLTRLISELP